MSADPLTEVDSFWLQISLQGSGQNSDQELPSMLCLFFLSHLGQIDLSELLKL